MTYQIESCEQSLLLDQVRPGQRAASETVDEHEMLVRRTSNGVRPDSRPIGGLEDLGTNDSADERLNDSDQQNKIQKHCSAWAALEAEF